MMATPQSEIRRLSLASISSRELAPATTARGLWFNARHLSHFHHQAPEQFEGAGGRSLRESIDESFRHLFRRHVGERFGITWGRRQVMSPAL